MNPKRHRLNDDHYDDRGEKKRRIEEESDEQQLLSAAESFSKRIKPDVEVVETELQLHLCIRGLSDLCLGYILGPNQ